MTTPKLTGELWLGYSAGLARHGTLHWGPDLHCKALDLKMGMPFRGLKMLKESTTPKFFFAAQQIDLVPFLGSGFLP